LYPTIYETVQMLQNGMIDYLGDIGNWVDLTYIWGSVIMSFLHATQNPGPYHWVSKAIMIVVSILSIRRTFQFMRVFSQFSPIVTMLTNVIWHLRIFLTFYFILILLFSLVLGVIGLGNPNIPGPYRKAFWVEVDTTETGTAIMGLSADAPTIIYEKIGQAVANFAATLRLSMGDFTLLGPSIFLLQSENIMFWISWFIILLITNIIFLNFIVAEASAIYSQVNESLAEYIQQQRGDLVAEAENLIPNWSKKERWFPRYLIRRMVF